MSLFSWFEKQLNPFSALPPTQPPKQLWGFCLHYTRGAWRYIALAAALMVCIALAEIWLFSFVGDIVNWLATQDKSSLIDNNRDKLLLMVAVILLLPALVFVHSLVSHQTLMGNYPMRIRWDVHRYLLQQSMAFYQQEFAGRIATKLMQTALSVRECVMKVVEVLNYISVYFIGALVLLAQADARMMVPMLLWLAAYLLMLRFFVPRLGRISARQADARSTMTGRIVDSYTNIQTVKLFSHSDRESEYAKEGMQAFMDTVYVQMRLVSWLNLTLYSINALLLLSIGALSMHLWLHDAIAVGTVAVALGLVLRLSGMSQWIMWEVGALFENIGTVQDGMQTIAMPAVVRDAEDAQPLRVPQGDILFDQVRFHYGKGSGVFDALNLHIRPGEKVGIVGRSGAGKSTLVNLLLRFYACEAGRIVIDGQDIASVMQNSLRAHIGMVTQDTSLLHRSVADNIRYGRPEASDAEVEAAARLASAHDFIVQLADAKGRTGYDAHVGERGVTLSGGQRQRIAIARVMLKNAPLLILDEATSALDSEVEAAIQDNLAELMRDKTVIAIAHRLSTIAAMDRLVVIDAGEIVETGTHHELLARAGIYAQLWARQAFSSSVNPCSK